MNESLYFVGNFETAADRTAFLSWLSSTYGTYTIYSKDFSWQGLYSAVTISKSEEDVNNTTFNTTDITGRGELVAVPLFTVVK